MSSLSPQMRLTAGWTRDEEAWGAGRRGASVGKVLEVEVCWRPPREPLVRGPFSEATSMAKRGEGTSYIRVAVAEPVGSAGGPDLIEAEGLQSGGRIIDNSIKLFSSAMRSLPSSVSQKTCNSTVPIKPATSARIVRVPIERPSWSCRPADSARRSRGGGEGGGCGCGVGYGWGYGWLWLDNTRSRDFPVLSFPSLLRCAISGSTLGSPPIPSGTLFSGSSPQTPARIVQLLGGIQKG